MNKSTIISFLLGLGLGTILIVVVFTWLIPTLSAEYDIKFGSIGKNCDVEIEEKNREIASIQAEKEFVEDELEILRAKYDEMLDSDIDSDNELNWIRKNYPDGSWNIEYPDGWNVPDELNNMEGYLSIDGEYKGNDYIITLMWPLGPGRRSGESMEDFSQRYASQGVSLDDWVEADLSWLSESERRGVEVKNKKVDGIDGRMVVNMPKLEFSGSDTKQFGEDKVNAQYFILSNKMHGYISIEYKVEGDLEDMEELFERFVDGIRF